MALPLPQVVSDVGPGGPLVTSMRGVNALANDVLSNQIKGVQAQYAPTTTLADAASKWAYANLMGPQFLAKMMGNKDILANMNNPGGAVNNLQNVAMGSGANALSGGIPGMPGGLATPNNGGFSNWLVNKVHSMFGGQGGQQAAPQMQQAPQQMPQYAPPQQQQPSNVFAGNPALSPTDQQNINSLQPGQSYVIQGNGSQPAPAQAPQQQTPAPNTKTFAKNVGAYEGLVSEGQESGKIRAQQLKDLDQTVYNADLKQQTLDDINDMISSPEIRDIRQLPLAGRHEMSWYAREGTPAQQQLVGRLYAQMGNIIKDSSRDFAGQFRKGEQQLLQGMKPSDADTVDTMIGKAESLSVMNQMLKQRAQLTANIMRQQNISQGEALDMADKQINGQTIRQQVHDKLNPTVTIRNRKTGEVMTVPAAEARQKYGVQ